MTKLTETEKAQLKRAARFNRSARSGRQPNDPRPAALSPADFMEFATFASQFSRRPNRTPFKGNHWKL